MKNKSIPNKIQTKYFKAAIKDIGERDFPGKKELNAKYNDDLNTYVNINIGDKYYMIKYEFVNENVIQSQVDGFSVMKDYPDLFVIPKSINFSPDGTPEDKMFLYYELDGRDGIGDRVYKGATLKKMEEFLKRLLEFGQLSYGAWVNFNMNSVITDSKGDIKIKWFQDIIFSKDLKEMYRYIGNIIPKSELEDYVEVKLDEDELYKFELSIIKHSKYDTPYELQALHIDILLYQFKNCIFYDYIPNELFEQLKSKYLDRK